MNNPQFVHLRMHSEFSIVDGIVRIKEAVKAAAADAMPALALTDLNNFFGLLKFYDAARTNGIKPILGADVWIEGENDESPSRLILLIKNVEGYRALSRLLTKAFANLGNKDFATISRAWLTKADCQHLIALSGGVFGEIGNALLNNNQKDAERKAQFWAELFPDSFYLEVQRFGQANAEVFVQKSVQLANALNLPLVATHPIQFLKDEQFLAHEVRVCIAEGEVLSNPKRQKHFTEDQYFKSQIEMAALFKDLPEALQNSVEIAKRCNLELKLGQHFLPDFPTPEGASVSDFMIDEAKKGLEKRLIQLYPDETVRNAKRPMYEERLAFESNTIVQMGFQGYFLIVADFINWGKNNNVPVGPGRGSGAGSLVAFALGITDIDPLAYALLFERFLNPERVSMPDFDVDFCQDNRGRVIDYVRERYGKSAVSQIVTFGTMASRAALRDVGRVLEMPYSLCDRLSKLIPFEGNRPVSLSVAKEKEPQIVEMMNDSRDGESIKNLFELAIALEDLTRNTGMHAGGVLIAPSKISDFCPMYLGAQDASLVSQFDKDDVEKIGLVKFDFLGLRNLTIINLALSYIEKETGKRPDLMALGFDDPAVYQLLKEANTTAVFQLESDGMKQLLKKLEPGRFEDIIAVLALYRPGPLNSGMVDDFIARKKGTQKIDFFHSDLKNVLEPTYGVIVYQEQVMQISQIIGGYTLGGADMLRRAMGKKKPEEMAKHRQTIIDGAIQKGYKEELAAHLFDLMAKFAEYGFNKSHTAAYAVLTYQTAWLKVHHPAAFMAATLSSEMDKTDTVKIFFDDAVKNHLKILPPSVNESDYRFVPSDSKTIRYGLGAIKGVGENAVLAMMAAREKSGKFKDLFDFCKRCDKQIVNRRALDSLIAAGAMDEFGMPREQLLANVETAMEYAANEQKNANQGSLFDALGDNANFAMPEYKTVPAWDGLKKLSEEKAVLGFYCSGHPFSLYSEELKKVVAFPLNKLQPKKESVWLAGVVSNIRDKMGKNGKMHFVTIDDGQGQLEVLLFSDVFHACRDQIEKDRVLLVKTKLEQDYQSQRLSARPEQVMGLANFRASFLNSIVLNVRNTDKITPQDLKTMISPFLGGNCRILIDYQNQKAACRLHLADDFLIRPNPQLFAALKQCLSNPVKPCYGDFPR